MNRLVSTVLAAALCGCSSSQRCPDVSDAGAVAALVISEASTPLRATVMSGSDDPSSKAQIVVLRALRAAGQWIASGLEFSGAIADEFRRVDERLSAPHWRVDVTGLGARVVGTVLVASFVTSPIGLAAGSLEGAAEAARYRARHDAAVHEVERELDASGLNGELGRVLHSMLSERSGLQVRVSDAGASQRPQCGVPVVLMAELAQIALESPSLIEFTARPVVRARYRLSADGREIDGQVEFKGRFRKFRDISDGEATLMAQELRGGVEIVAAGIFEALSSQYAWQRPKVQFARSQGASQ